MFTVFFEDAEAFEAEWRQSLCIGKQIMFSFQISECIGLHRLQAGHIAILQSMLGVF